MVGLNTTNLGDQAFATRLITQDISSTSYSQPFQQLGTLAAPLAPNTNVVIPYVAGYSKYVCYVTSSTGSGVALGQSFTVSGCPVNLVGSFTISGSANWIVTGVPVVGTLPAYTNGITVRNSSAIPPPQSSIIDMNVVSTAPPVYSGTAIFKMVININLD